MYARYRPAIDDRWSYSCFVLYDAVFFVAGSRGTNVQGVDYEGLAKAVKTAEHYCIQRFIYLSSININKQPEQYLQEMTAFYQRNNEIIQFIRIV